ncbi:hypothetical protein GCM10009754_78380 [Amycolatopsis minnesotensis]|uniref:Uncharacterized protein n=2 Tax=Amycolatopsis minnesotensis TaxID=337894 RepID=A0ABN2SMZ0_9PSEU
MLGQATAGMGYSTPVPSIADPKKSCESEKQGFGGVSLLLQPDKAINERPSSGNAKSAHIGSRVVIQTAEPIGTKGDCNIAMEVQPSSQAVVIVSNNMGDTNEACTRAQSFAEKLHGMLPP